MGIERQVIAVLRRHYSRLILVFLTLVTILVVFFGLPDRLLVLLVFVFFGLPDRLLAVFAAMQRTLLIIGALGGGLAILALLWKVPKWQAARLDLTPQEKFTVENEARKTLAQIVGGAAVLVSIYFTWGSLEISREGQITDRFTKAVTQLGEQGPEKLAVRLGGIYALERIARDSEKDRWPVMEVLTAYVRANARAVPKEASPSNYDQFPSKELLTMPSPPPPIPAADIQAILAVVGRITQIHNGREGQRLDLTEADLRGAILRKAHLQRAILRKAHLQGADLREAKLQRVNLAGAQLQGADLREAQLQRADLPHAHLQGADLREAQLQKAYLQEVQLQGADLRDAGLQGATLFRAQLQEADLAGAQLQGTYFREAQLQGAKNLMVEQLSVVMTLYQAQLDPPLLEQIQRQYPHLLEKPQ